MPKGEQGMSTEKIELLEELLKNKVSQANSLKESMKPVEAFCTVTKELCKKINEIIEPKKIETLEMVSKGRLQGEAYKYMAEILNSLSSVVDASNLESEKMMSVKQQELNFLANEYTKLKEVHGKLVAEINKAKIEAEKQVTQQEEKTAETVVPTPKENTYVRPDQNPNTKIGRASMDLQKRRAAKTDEEKA